MLAGGTIEVFEQSLEVLGAIQHLNAIKEVALISLGYCGDQTQHDQIAQHLPDLSNETHNRNSL